MQNIGCGCKNTDAKYQMSDAGIQMPMLDSQMQNTASADAGIQMRNARSPNA
jgi:hypothetical protein